MKNIFLAIYSGAGIGLLVGLIMGLALSPVVGIIAGALASSLAVLLGLNDKHFSDTKSLRIGSFGFACIIGALVGLFIRVNSLFAPDIATEFARYRAVEFTPEEARAFIAFKRFGIVDKDWIMYQGKTVPADSLRKRKRQGVAEEAAQAFNESLAQRSATVGFFGAEVRESECHKLADVNEELPLPNILQKFEFASPLWKKLALAIEAQIPEDQQKGALLAAKYGICSAGAVKFEDQDCAKLAARAGKIPDDEFLELAGKQGKVWLAITEEVKERVAPAQQIKLIHIIIRNVCDEKS